MITSRFNLRKATIQIAFLAVMTFVGVVAPSSDRTETSKVTPIMLAGDPTPPRPDIVIIAPLTLFPWAS